MIVQKLFFPFRYAYIIKYYLQTKSDAKRKKYRVRRGKTG